MFEKPTDWLTKLVPQGAADFLSSYWYVILGGVGVAILLLLWILIRKLFAGKKPPHPSEIDRTEDLSKYPELKPSTGDRRLIDGLAALCATGNQLRHRALRVHLVGNLGRRGCARDR